MIVSCGKKRAVASYADAGHGHVFGRDELVGAFVRAQVEDSNIAASVCADYFALIWVDNHIVDGVAVRVVALNRACTCVPDFHGRVFRAGDHPFCLAMECDGCNVVAVTLKDHDRLRVRALDVV